MPLFAVPLTNIFCGLMSNALPWLFLPRIARSGMSSWLIPILTTCAITRRRSQAARRGQLTAAYLATHSTTEQRPGAFQHASYRADRRHVSGVAGRLGRRLFRAPAGSRTAPN